jgi:hypothetical protein|tara:strand:- start:4223 stop:4402 length:180 start_codon:yes stop_codon:yes gene_type:complete
MFMDAHSSYAVEILDLLEKDFAMYQTLMWVITAYARLSLTNFFSFRYDKATTSSRRGLV